MFFEFSTFQTFQNLGSRVESKGLRLSGSDPDNIPSHKTFLEPLLGSSTEDSDAERKKLEANSPTTKYPNFVGSFEDHRFHPPLPHSGRVGSSFTSLLALSDSEVRRFVVYKYLDFLFVYLDI